LPAVLSQTIRTVIHSRLENGLASYQTKFKGADVVLIEPHRDDYMMFFTNIFSFSERRAVCEYSYNSVRRDLLARYDELAPIFARHGLTLRKDVLEEKRSLWLGVFRERPERALNSSNTVARRLDDALGRLERLLEDGLGTPAS
jgi:hypothetical protein